MLKLSYRGLTALSLFMAATALAAPNTNLNWSDDFESYPDKTPLALGTNGWYASSTNAQVQTEVYETGTRAAAIPMDTALTNRFASMSPTNIWLRFRVRPVLAHCPFPALVNTNAASIIFVTSNGFFGTCNGNITNWNTCSNTLAGVPYDPMTPDEWVTIHMRNDYATKKWSLFGKNLFLADQVPFLNTNATFRSFSFYNGIHTTFLDNVQVLTNFPADLAADGGDWLPDLEIQPGGLPTTLASEFYQGDPYTTNYTIWKTNGLLALAYYHAMPWLTNGWVAMNPSPGVTTGIYNTVTLSYNTTNIPARITPYTAQLIVNGTDSRFGQPARKTPRQINLEIKVSLRASTNLVISRGNYADRIRVQWSKVIGAERYFVYRNLTNDPSGAQHFYTTSASIFDDLDVLANTRYYYWVKSDNFLTTSALSISNWGFCGMVTPTGVTATDGDFHNRIQVMWITSGANAIYQIWRNTSNNRAAASLIGSTTDLLYNDFTAAQETVYYYWLRATNVLGVTEFSLPDTGFLGLQSPAVTATDGSITSSVGLAWAAIPGATGYEAWRGATEKTSDATRIAVTTNLYYNDPSVPPGIVFYYRILATNHLTRSALSDPDSGFRGVPFPTGLTASDGTYSDKVLVTWTASEGASSYEIWSGNTDNPASSRKIGETAALSFSDTTGDVDSTYYYWARARVGSILSQFSVSAAGSRRSTTPPSSPPAWVDASDGAFTNRIHIRWPDTPETAQYEVWRNTINDSSAAILIRATSARSCDDTNVIAGMTYYYWVRGRNLSGIGDFSLPDSGYAAPEAPTGYADLELTDLIFLPNIIACGNHPGAISMRVINRGPDALRAPDTRVTVDFFIMTNRTFSAIEARWIGDYNTDISIAPDKSYRLIIPRSFAELLSMPIDLTGTFNVFARIRHSYPSGLADPSMANNTTTRKTPIEIPQQGGGIYQVRNDFDNDGASDLALYHQTSGAWYILGANGQILAWNLILGGPAYTPLSGDFNADRMADIAVYKNGIWAISDVRGNPIISDTAWGGSGFTPVPGDFDGDGYADLAVYQEATASWYIVSLTRGIIAFGELWGGPGLWAAPADYSGTGCTDLSVYGHGGFWYIRPLTNRGTLTWQKNWGYYNMFPVPGDYDGDGYADLAVYGNGYWFIRTVAGDLVLWADHWGSNGYLPVPGDYDGDGKADLAVYHVLSGAWFIKSADQNLISWGLSFGGPGFAPVGAWSY